MHSILKRFSLKYLYLFSTFGVALMACAVVGMLLYFSAVHELRAKSEHQMLERLELFLDDMQVQTDIMQDIANGISTRIYYKKYYFERNAYYELELLKEFEKFKNNSAVIDDFFLHYRGYDWVFRSNRTKYRFDELLRLYGLEGAPEGLSDAVNAVRGFTILPFGRHAVLFAFPVYTAGKYESDGMGTVGFVVSASALKNRLIALSGEMLGNVRLYFANGLHLDLIQSHDSALDWLSETTGTPTPIERRADESTVFRVAAPNASFALSLHVQRGESLPGHWGFNIVNKLYVLLAVLFLLVLSVLIGYNNYLPVKRLSSRLLRKLNGPADMTGNELHSLERLLDAVLEEKESAQASLQRQYGLIKKTILLLLLNGDARYAGLVSKPFMGIHLPSACFMIAAVRIEQAVSSDMEALVSEQVEALSEDDTALYCTLVENEAVFAILIGAEDDSACKGVAELVVTLLREQYACRIGLSSAFASLAESKRHFAQALHACSLPAQASDPGMSAMDLWFDEEQVGRVFLAMQTGNAQSAIFLLRMVIDRSVENAKTYPHRQYMLHNLLYQLTAFAKAKGIAVDSALVEQAMQASVGEDAPHALEQLVKHICVSREAQEEDLKADMGKNEKRAEDMLRFVEENYCDGNMSLDLLSEKFGLSTRYISSIIKERTGLPYKEYLTKLRIDKAQALLLCENITVSSACKNVGYAHLPHFIKTFKRITGFTPSNYSQRKSPKPPDGEA